MSGPCMCGDPYCPSCGSPERAKLEEAEEAAAEEMYKANLTADEWALCARAGLSVVMECREAANRAIQQIAEAEAEEAAAERSNQP